MTSQVTRSARSAVPATCAIDPSLDLGFTHFVVRRGGRLPPIAPAPRDDHADEHGEREEVDELDGPVTGVCEDEHG